MLRGDIAVWPLEPVTDAARGELLRLPGVTAVESSRMVPVVLVHGHRRQRSEIRGYAPQPELYRIVDADGRQV